jgi:FkbH-like protein
MLAAAAPDRVVIFDLDHQSALFGKARWLDHRFWYHSKHPFDFDAIGRVAHVGAQILASSKGLSKKCLVLDLDNTLWGGVIGDDGLDGIKLGTDADGEAFMAFQAYVKSLKERGVILAVCSKNEEATAKEPFLRHPDMKLGLEDIAVFRANWNNKVENIRQIANTLNIGLDSLVFVDDNPAEREIVRRFLPMIEVPELPEDPSDYVNALAAGCFFETVTFSAEDKERARYYKENAQRAELQLSFTDAADYLRSLEMSSEGGSADKFHLPRMSQLINKSNQFHLTGTRYSEAELEGFSKRDDITLRFFKLRDRFGDNGLISVLVLKQEEALLVIDTWVMSCRVLGRSMEEFIAAEILDVAHARNCRAVIGRYVPSLKNKLVSGLYARLGFTLLSDENGVTTWRRDVNETKPVTQIGRVTVA